MLHQGNESIHDLTAILSSRNNEADVPALPGWCEDRTLSLRNDRPKLLDVCVDGIQDLACVCVTF